MPAISGVATKRTSKGKLTHITIDVRKHQQAIPVLKQLGLVPKTQFDIDCENGETLEESKAAVLAAIKEYYANNT